MCLYTFVLANISTHVGDRNPDSPSARNNAPSPCFLRLAPITNPGRKWKASGGALPHTENPTADRSEMLLRFPRLFPMTSPYRPLDFPMGVFSEHHKFAYHPICHLLFPAGSAGCKRQRRGTRYGLVEKVGGRNRRETCVFRKFPRSPMCKYLSRVSGPARAAICTRMIVLQHSYTHATRTHTQLQSYYARKPQYASGSCVNTCIKMSAFACLHPSPRYPPLSDSFCTPRLRFSCLYAGIPRRRRRRHRRVCVQPAKMSSDLERVSRMLTLSGTSWNDYAHDLHRRMAMQSCIRAATVPPSRETVDADAR